MSHEVDAMLRAREGVPTRPWSPDVRQARHSGLLRLNVTWPPWTCSMWHNAGTAGNATNINRRRCEGTVSLLAQMESINTL
jgi:hypothetical protein